MIEIEYTEPTLIDKIRLISEKYSKKHQWKKTREEAEELLEELETTSNPYGYEDCVYPGWNMWSETADVLIMLTQMIMQHNAASRVMREVEYKTDRQIERMREEGLLSVEDYARYSGGAGWQFVRTEKPVEEGMMRNATPEEQAAVMGRRREHESKNGCQRI